MPPSSLHPVEVPVANTAGKAFAITVVTPMPSWKTPFLRFVFFMIGRLGVPKKDQENLVRLSFIHFARWVIIPRHKFPRLSADQPREELHYDYFLFCSNFNGTWEQYIDAFSDVIPGGMNNIWRWSVGYPGSRPISPFLDYIARNQYDVEYYWSATPGAATNDIVKALELSDALDAFTPRGLALEAEAFEPAWHALLASVQGCLATTGETPVGVAPDASTEPHLLRWGAADA